MRASIRALADTDNASEATTIKEAYSGELVEVQGNNR
jgi:hypothetical protein